MRKHGLLPVLMIVLALTLVACGGGNGDEDSGGGGEEANGGAPAPESIDVVMHDIYYGDENTNVDNPPTWTVTNGAEVTVQLDNQGALQHNWAIVKQGQEVPDPYTGGEENPDLLLYNGGVKDPGVSVSETFTAPAAGEYLVICTVAGHYPLMQGRLVVE